MEAVIVERAYIAGPMRGYALCNFGAFDAAAALVRAMGGEAVSPAEHDRDGGFPSDTMETCSDDELAAAGFNLQGAMRWDLGVLLDPTTTDIILLPGWEASSGARLEEAVARAMGLHIWNYHPPEAGAEGLGTITRVAS